MKERSKKGSVMVEASLIFPILVLIVVSLLSYASDNYEKIKAQVYNHNLLREESMDGCTSSGESEFIRKIDFIIEEIKCH